MTVTRFAITESPEIARTRTRRSSVTVPLAADPDRLFPPIRPPGGRAGPLGAGRAAADPLRPRPRRRRPAGRRPAVHRPGGAAGHPRPLRHPAAARQRRTAGPADARAPAHRRADVWRQFCEGWPAFAGTASGYWIAGELYHVFGLDEEPSADTGRRALRRTSRRRSPRRSSGRARCSSGSGSRCSRPPTTRSTTWPPTRTARPTPAGSGRVLPTFRPDRYLAAGAPGWAGRGRPADRRGRRRPGRATPAT